MPTLKAGWRMPEAPVEGAIPAFYNDGGEVWLHWVRDDEEHLPVEEDGVEIDIDWPFVEDFAKHSDLESLGFTNIDP